MTAPLPPPPFSIAGRPIGPGQPVYVIAELSCNHLGRFDRAAELVRIAADVGVDAVKLQTYTPDTMTLDDKSERFTVGRGTPWTGQTLYEIYREAQTPWAWHAPLKELAESLGICLFSSAFDPTSVDFLVDLGMPAFKIASFELVDLPLIRRVAATGKPMILSTGMASLPEIDAGVSAARDGGAQVAILRCNSAYPAAPAEMDLRTIPAMASTWHVPVGLSDHTLGHTAAVTAVALGASLLEKHIILYRSEGGPDSAFSCEPDEFRSLVTAVHEAEQALGTVRYGPSEHEHPSLAFRRSLFVVTDMRAGDIFTPATVRSVRPGDGLVPGALGLVLGRTASVDISCGTPLSWDLVGGIASASTPPG